MMVDSWYYQCNTLYKDEDQRTKKADTALVGKPDTVTGPRKECTQHSTVKELPPLQRQFSFPPIVFEQFVLLFSFDNCLSFIPNIIA